MRNLASNQEMQINTMVGIISHFRWAKSKSHAAKCWQECAAAGTFLCCWWACKLISRLDAWVLWFLPPPPQLLSLLFFLFSLLFLLLSKCSMKVQHANKYTRHTSTSQMTFSKWTALRLRHSSPPPPSESPLHAPFQYYPARVTTKLTSNPIDLFSSIFEHYRNAIKCVYSFVSGFFHVTLMCGTFIHVVMSGSVLCILMTVWYSITCIDHDLSVLL